MPLIERWRAWRAIRGHAALTASSAEGSHVRATGIVGTLDETVIAPISGRECVLSRSRIRGTSTMPPPLVQFRPFVLEMSRDEHIVVDGASAIFGVPAVKLGQRDVERQMSFAARFALKAADRAWFEEMIIAVGDRITVGGVVMHDVNPLPPTGERAFRDRPTPRLRLVGSVKHPLVIVPPR